MKYSSVGSNLWYVCSPTISDTYVFIGLLSDQYSVPVGRGYVILLCTNALTYFVLYEYVCDILDSFMVDTSIYALSSSSFGIVISCLVVEIGLGGILLISPVEKLMRRSSIMSFRYYVFADLS